MAGYYTITTADNGKVLGFPLLTAEWQRQHLHRRDGDPLPA